MNMLEPDWKQERPTSKAISELWLEPVFAPDPWTSPVLDELLAELRATHSNGGAFFARFSFACNPGVHWFVSRNRFDEIRFFEHLLTSDAIRESLPELKAPKRVGLMEWEWWSPYLLGGDWARTLMMGGPYEKYKKGARAAKLLGDAACSALFEDRFEDIQVFRTATPWSEWFFDVAWDITWVGVDKRELRVWLLCLTDTD